MKLERLYKEIINKGIEADVRSHKEIDAGLKKKKKVFDKLDKKGKEFFDPDDLFNPYSDTRILNGSLKADINSVIVGIDVEVGELLAMDRLNEKGKKIDLAIAHHPEGYAFAKFYEVMDLQADIFAKEGIPISACENLLGERKLQVARRVHAANHSRSVDVASLLNLNYLCMHTPCDNLANQFLKKQLNKAKPQSLEEVMDLLLTIPEYADAAKKNNAPMIAVGSKNSRCKNIHLEFTGGTEGPKQIYSKLSEQGVDTIVAMHQSEEHFKKCKEANINVIFASHIASDNIGINIMLDHLESKGKLKVFEFSGFGK